MIPSLQIPWQRRERHHYEFLVVTKSLNMLDSQGRVRRWNGPEFMKIWKRLGHSMIDFHHCDCTYNEAGMSEEDKRSCMDGTYV